MVSVSVSLCKPSAMRDRRGLYLKRCVMFTKLNWVQFSRYFLICQEVLQIKRGPVRGRGSTSPLSVSLTGYAKYNIIFLKSQYLYRACVCCVKTSGLTKPLNSVVHGHIYGDFDYLCPSVAEYRRISSPHNGVNSYEI